MNVFDDNVRPEHKWKDESIKYTAVQIKSQCLWAKNAGHLCHKSCTFLFTVVHATASADTMDSEH